MKKILSLIMFLSILFLNGCLIDSEDEPGAEVSFYYYNESTHESGTITCSETAGYSLYEDREYDIIIWNSSNQSVIMNLPKDIYVGGLYSDGDTWFNFSVKINGIYCYSFYDSTGITVTVTGTGDTISGTFSGYVKKGSSGDRIHITSGTFSIDKD
jgi:hypothetical protein